MKSSNPLVSIIIPVYNGSNYLKEAIDSALAQTYPNIEILVINDGSTDSGATENIAKTYRNKIRYYYKKNDGVATALNFGIKKMKGEWFSWLSHDDIYIADKIEKIVDKMQGKTSFKVFYTNFELVDKDASHLHDVSVQPTSISSMRVRLLNSYPVNGCAMLIHKSCFAKVGYFDSHLKTTQDYDLWFRLAIEYQFVHIPISSLKSRQHQEQDSYSNNHKEEVDSLYASFISNISERELQNELGKRTGSWLLNLIRTYFSRGYVMAPKQGLEKYLRMNYPVNLPYILTVFYSKLPISLLQRSADIKHVILRQVYIFTGVIKNILYSSRRISK